MNLKVELYDDGETWKIEHEQIGEIAHCTSPEWARRLADALNRHRTLMSLVADLKAELVANARMLAWQTDATRVAETKIAKLRAAQEWHPASEPPNTARSTLLILDVDGARMYAEGYWDGRKWNHHYEFCAHAVLWWAEFLPMPQPPERAKEAAK